MQQQSEGSCCWLAGLPIEYVDDLSLWQLQQTCRLFRNRIHDEDENPWYQRFLQRYSQSCLPQLDTSNNLQLSKHQHAEVREVQATGNGVLLLNLKGNNRKACIMQDLRSLSKASPLHGGNLSFEAQCVEPSSSSMTYEKESNG
ncbi:hypothetical protein QOT17_015664 [Balamuthia mandrillaris]